MLSRGSRRCFVVLLVFALAVALGGCGGENTLFERLPASQTGVDFANTIVENDSLLNPIDFSYVYNGAGVAVGDFDGDDRPDLYFAGNTVDNALYLNRGDFEFEEVTEQANAAAEGAWSTGVATVDVNQDGLMDVYVCVAGPASGDSARANRLFVNQGLNDNGVPTFREAAEAYGIADTGYSTQAAFFDYDRDGDLDLYLLTNAIDQGNRNAPRPIKTKGQAPSTDRLYRNEGNGTFTNVSEEAGIQTEGFGLGAAVSDLDQDGWPDVYVANDFLSNDLLWMNQGDGTFKNRLGEVTKHQTHNGMGNDVADFNNDGRPDIAVVDMLPPDNERKKLMLPGRSYNVFHMALRRGYEPQYLRNTLQLNRGRSPAGDPAFSEIGQLAGVHATDWSWAPLFADFNNDGHKDLFISNGYGKDVTNLDHIKYGQQTANFGTPEAKRKQAIKAMKNLDEVRLQNYVFKNDGDLTFTDKSEAWGMGPSSISNGAAYADFDGDGDLDLVTNNIDDEAFILKNRARERATGDDQQSTARYLRVELKGPQGNRAGYGAKVVLQNGGGRTQYIDHSPYRGYKSTTGRTLHFGLGAASAVDSLTVYWSDGRQQLLTDVAANQTVRLDYGDAAVGPPQDRRAPFLFEGQPEGTRLFRAAAARTGLTYEHAENEVIDFKKTPLLPHQLSRQGPGVAVGDLDGDGRDDVFLGGDHDKKRALFMQRSGGRFAQQALPVKGRPVAEARHEDLGALFFDADGDGDDDLYVVSGGSHAPAGSPAYQDRLYLNDGAGRLRRATDGALPKIRASGSCVRAADYDADGDLDLFVGGRLTPGRYPLPPRSYVLRNDSEDGRVTFTDVTKEVAPALAEAGMVTDALWTDFNGDGRVDLLVAGEWMPLTFFKNEGGRFENVTGETGLPATAGWWNSLAAGDFDGDGDTDYVAGNLGRNNKYDVSPEEPVRIYAKDFDDNGSIDPIITRYIQGTEVPDASRDALIDQIIGMKGRFRTYRAYAEARFEEMFREEELKGAYTARAVRFASSYLENEGDGQFAIRRLPTRAQFAPIYGIRTDDYNGDGRLDLLAVGNSYAPDPQTGRYDASVGHLLAGDGTGRFERVDYPESGFWVEGDAKGLAEVRAEGQSLVLATQNSDSLRVFADRPAGSTPAGSTPDREGRRVVALRPMDAYATVHFEGGKTRREEFYYGSTFLSQSSRVLRVPPGARKAVIHDFQGHQRTVRFGGARQTASAAR